MLAVLAVMSAATSGCFAPRMVRSDTTTSYDLVRAPTQVMPVASAMPAPSSSDGTLVVEALVVPPAPSATTGAIAPRPPAMPMATARPVRIPDAIAGAVVGPAPTAHAAPAWDPLPSYVGQFQGSSFASHPIFGGGTTPSSSFRSGGWRGYSPGTTVLEASHPPSGRRSPVSSPSTFLLPPPFSGSTSSHFSGGSSISGY